jgi:hypothetical protein
MKIAAVIAALVVVAWFALRRFAESHRRWLEKQSPVGVWTSTVDGSTVLLQFDGGPREGVYSQVTQTAEGPIKEYGHWLSHGHLLRLIMMASDIKGQERFGIDTEYELRYTAPDRIRIFGPDRPGIEYRRTSDDQRIDFGKVEQNNRGL